MARRIGAVAALLAVALVMAGCAGQTARAKVDGGSLSMDQFMRDFQGQGGTIHREWKMPVFPPAPCSSRFYGPEVVQ